MLCRFPSCTSTRCGRWYWAKTPAAPSCRRAPVTARAHRKRAGYPGSHGTPITATVGALIHMFQLPNTHVTQNVTHNNNNNNNSAYISVLVVADLMRNSVKIKLLKIKIIVRLLFKGIKVQTVTKTNNIFVKTVTLYNNMYNN